MRGTVDRRAAASRCRTWPRLERLERPGLAGQRVVQADGHARRPRRSRRAIAAIERPAPSAPSRLPVDALTLTAPAVEPEQRRRSPRASASRWAPSLGRAPMTVRSTAPGASRRLGEPARPRRRAARCSRRPAGVRASAGKRRPRSPSPAAPSSASATAWSATSPSEWPARRGRAGDLTPPSRSGSPGPNGWLSWPIPIRGARGAQRAPARAEIVGQRHLEVRWVAGDGMDRDLQASSRAASSVNSRGPSAGNRPVCPHSSSRRDPLRRLGRPEVARSTVADDVRPRSA